VRVFWDAIMRLVESVLQCSGVNGDTVALTPSRASDNTEFHIKSLIYSGQLAPGEKLPPERELSKQLGVAAVTLRSALRSLETAGLISIKRGSAGGSTVVDEKALNGLWNEWVRKHRAQLREMLEFLQVIQIETAALAAERRTVADLRALESAVKQFEDTDDTALALRYHAHFHDALTKAARNVYLLRASNTVQGEVFMRRDVATHSRADMATVHEHVLLAVRDKNSEEARVAMKAHAAFRRRLYGIKD
jgi:GntR family transcriptional repressor for pyruvate dehydrogenase complex